jgi:hypothetical protein
MEEKILVSYSAIQLAFQCQRKSNIDMTVGVFFPLEKKKCFRSASITVNYIDGYCAV